MKLEREIILASTSPRRKELLSACGLKFRVVPADIEENVVQGESPEAMVRRLAGAKAYTISAKYPEAWVVGADTVVVNRGEVLGKPRDAADARRMLQQLEGREHEVWGAFALECRARRALLIEAHMTRVKFVSLSAEQIDAYIASGEPLDKAGAYAIQGCGSQFVSAISGSYTNVVGLNTAALMQALRGVW